MTDGLHGASVTPRHFASALLRDLREARRLREKAGKLFQPGLDWLEELLPKAIHFTMPEGGSIFFDGLRGLDVGIRLPFPVVALEYVCQRAGGSQFLGQVICPERVAVAVDLSQTDSRPAQEMLLNWSAVPQFDSGIIVISCARAYGVFSALPAAVWFDPDSVIDVTPEMSSSINMDEQRKFYDFGEEGDIQKKAFSKEAILPMIPEACGALAMQHGRRVAEKALYADVIDELHAVHEFMEAMSCSNVEASLLAPAPKRLNAAREKKGRPPIFEYRVITLKVPAQAAKTQAGGDDSGRASPRVHLRRGHIRRLPNRKVWVNAAVIGSKERGVIASDYRIERGVGIADEL